VKGFPWHPHRGIETITYMLRGEVDHGDSMGNSGSIRPGGVQWMTAGSGIIHQEMPRGQDDGSMWGFQLWANLPASRKMMTPRYRDVKRDTVPEVTLAGGAKAKIICGNVMGTEGPVTDIVIEPEYLDVTLQPGTTIGHAVKEGHTVFAYVLDGEGYFDQVRDPYSYEIKGANYFDMNRDCLVKNESLVLFDDGDHVLISADKSAVRFLLVSGKPLKEPVAWFGPIVMNTQEELKMAFEEYREGTFIKHGK
ncbi:MAG: pirin family protein, partial [Nitrospiraceae bacterium]